VTGLSSSATLINERKSSSHMFMKAEVGAV
jgi:hypothetical protein